ncbi:hypothetical protein [Bradyrhizobium sp. AUGA SZCCT0431]|uniref:hypothetical protein n=1 Tax=Bradyrhizobium sp. AUGA SZCCT0431 TaxID=2807674 RepID=UPI001BA9D78A|nr:hypothetical protein [Bradyrhizobium sp. AUGA SZCCT0431]MBR1146535.1 hypothetical protein [Bradyrhizobium sp. AUGA SZCCT0431]
MHDIHALARDSGGLPRENGNAAMISAADFLYLAAAPTFAIMALLTSFLGSSDALCASAGASPLGGMVPMYLLMSAFHLAPWLKLISHRRNGVRRR